MNCVGFVVHACPKEWESGKEGSSLSLGSNGSGDGTLSSQRTVPVAPSPTKEGMRHPYQDNVNMPQLLQRFFCATGGFSHTLITRMILLRRYEASVPR